jgi:hypothetical protein
VSALELAGFFQMILLGACEGPAPPEPFRKE